jgi:hypothetical protein
MRLSPELRKELFWTGFGVQLVNIIFYFVWPHIRLLNPCRQRAGGIELGLLVAVIAFILSLFGNGWKRLTLATVAIVASYFWFCWLLWMAEMEC